MDKIIAVVDDEPDILELVSINLEREGYNVKTFEDAGDFLSFIRNQRVDLVVLDLMMPGYDGLDICKQLRNSPELSDMGIIILSAKGDEIDRVVGLELGADDYVPKPFSPKELAARIKALLRRKKPSDKTSTPEPAEQLKILGGIMEIDPNRFKVKINNETIELTSTEFRILEVLASKPGWVFSREKILEYLWGNEKLVLDRTVDVHIKKLRDKLGSASKFVKSVRGIGYKLEEE